MGWFSKFLTSSIGQKIIMALTGIFLILFLVVHLMGNLQLLKDDGGEAFNIYAYFMTHNPLIKTVSYLLYAAILLHAVQGILLWQMNKAARGAQRYAVSHVRASERASRNMAWLGIIIFVFIALHLYQFWFQMHWGTLVYVEYDTYPHAVKDLYALVAASYENLGFVVFYVISMFVVGYHLWHGFWSAFQTLGLNHSKYTPLIKGIGAIYSIAVPLLFAAIPVVMYLKN
ncbi:MAG: succinate dehydrogenase cytochrome b subunit [Saprospirales bacterium]|nr:succinate dehydrogenase cytochrome b subunit [Saprospirales bacterium]MBK8922682.1 succinate dehydrogenase cytochrome b subunit [Saprospirales bacterium]